jgi:hypothetical protein
LVLGLALLAAPLSVVAVAWLSLVGGGRVNAAAACAGPLAAAAVIAATRSGRARLGSWALAAALLALALGFGASFVDRSWDGLAYHQPAIRALLAGWNPLWDGPLPLADAPDNLWVNHYPKAAWLAEAAVAAALGAVEPAKGLQGIVLGAAFLLTHAALRARGLRPVAAVAGAVVLAGNPVALAQLPSFYVDGLNASLMTCLFAMTLLLWQRGSSDPWLRGVLLAGIGGALAFMINLKFTGVPYALFFAAGTSALFALGGRPWRPLSLTAVAALAFGVGGLGFDPYATNLLRKGHPFYPVRGPGAVDFLSPQLVPAFHQRHRFSQLWLTLMSRASNRNEMPVGKAPLSLSIDPDEWQALAYADLRIGGFGPLFGAGVLAAGVLAVGVVAAGRRRTQERETQRTPRGRPWLGPQGLLLGGGGLLLTSAFCTPGVWWARYVPQLWLVPAGLVVLGVVESGRRWSLVTALQMWRWGTAALLALNLAVVAAAAHGGAWAGGAPRGAPTADVVKTKAAP